MSTTTPRSKPPRQVSAGALTTLKHLECRNGQPNLVAYLDDAGVWTIGFGHTGADVYRGVTCTPLAAEQMLDMDLEHVEWAICRRDPQGQLNTHQFDALALLLFNTGTAALDQPHFRAAMAPDRVTGKINLAAVANQFHKWVYVTDPETHSKHRDPGLVNRRAAELALWHTPAPTALPAIDVPPFHPLVSGYDTTQAAPRAQAPAPLVPIPVQLARVAPTPPPSTVAQSPGGKSFLATIGSVLVATGGEMVSQIQDLISQLQEIRYNTEGLGKWGHVLAIAMGATVIGIACYTFWARRREVQRG